MNKIKLNVKFEIDENFIHPNFTKVAIWVATYGENANGSDITRDAFVNAIPTLFNIPILGEWNESIEDFKGHGGKIVIDDDGIQWIQTTKAYGAVPESCNPRWELDEEGIEYLVCDGILWTDRYEEALKVKENTNNQSMEIEVISSEDNDGVMQITEFVFTGLCILGEDTQPCFPSAKVVYSLNKDEFKKEFSLLLNEIKNIDFNKGGKETKMKREDIIAKFSNLSGEKYEAVINNQDLSLEDLESQLFALSVNDLYSRISESLQTNTVVITDYWGDTYETAQYGLEDIITDGNIAIVYSREDWNDYGIPYTLDGDSITLDYSKCKRYVKGDWREYVDGQSNDITNPIIQSFNIIDEHNKNKVNDVQAQFTEKSNELDKVKGEFVDLQSKFSELETEVESLRQFKIDNENEVKKSEIDSIIAEFSEAKEVEGFNESFENVYDFEVEDLKTKLKVFCFDNGIVIGKKQTKKKDTKAKFSLVDDVKKTIPVVDKEWEKVSKYYNK